MGRPNNLLRKRPLGHDQTGRLTNVSYRSNLLIFGPGLLGTHGKCRLSFQQHLQYFLLNNNQQANSTEDRERCSIRYFLSRTCERWVCHQLDRSIQYLVLNTCHKFRSSTMLLTRSVPWYRSVTLAPIIWIQVRNVIANQVKNGPREVGFSYPSHPLTANNIMSLIIRLNCCHGCPERHWSSSGKVDLDTPLTL